MGSLSGWLAPLAWTRTSRVSNPSDMEPGPIEGCGVPPGQNPGRRRDPKELLPVTNVKCVRRMHAMRRMMQERDATKRDRVRTRLQRGTMKKCILASIVGTLVAAPRAGLAQAPAADSVSQTLTSLFDAMRTADTARARSAFL